MPREDLSSRILSKKSVSDLKERLYQKYGVFVNPFPSAGQTSGHPRLETEADNRIDDEIVQFVNDVNRRSHVIALMASQGIGKTNLLNAYERELKDVLEPLGFFIIRYIPDPEPSFDPLIRTIFDALGEDHLKELANALAGQRDEDVEFHLKDLRSEDMRRMLRSLCQAVQNSQPEINDIAKLAQEWLLGLRVYKAHRETLNIRYRLDTVESKTRALRDLVICSYSTGKLQGVFLLLDELEKQDDSLSKTMVVRYFAAIRALIDALPRNLFLMMALTIDALNKYSEMFPALRGRLASEVQLNPLQNSNEAMDLCRFYQEEARNLAKQELAKEKRLTSNRQAGDTDIVSAEDVRGIFQRLYRDSIAIEGVRQRDFLNELHRRAQQAIEYIQ